MLVPRLQAEVDRLNELARVNRTRHDQLLSEKGQIDTAKHSTETATQGSTWFYSVIQFTLHIYVKFQNTAGN
jgi:hypothetical protein